MSNEKEFMKNETIDGYIEDASERRLSVNDEVTDLSAIEATAASRAAWLISVTVSMGGFLFGKLIIVQSKHEEALLTFSKATTLATSHPCWLLWARLLATSFLRASRSWSPLLPLVAPLWEPSTPV